MIVKLINETTSPIILQRRVTFRRSGRPDRACGEEVIPPGGCIKGFVQEDKANTWTLYAGADVLIDAPKSLFKMERV